MKKQDFRSLTIEELTSKEKTLRDELFKLNQQRYAGRVEKPHMFGIIKKDIARIQTILSPVRNTKAKTEQTKISNGVNEKKEK